MSFNQYDWYILGAVACLTVVSFLTRAGYFLFGDHLPLADGVRRALRYAPVAALTAIILPEIFPWSVGSYPRLDLYKLIAVGVAVLVYLRTHNSVWLMVSGMAIYWLLKALA